MPMNVLIYILFVAHPRHNMPQLWGGGVPTYRPDLKKHVNKGFALRLDLSHRLYCKSILDLESCDRCSDTILWFSPVLQHLFFCRLDLGLDYV